MNTMDHTLPDELLYEPDGHLTETALTCAADGQPDLISAAALAHLDECDHCSHRLGEAALLSLAAGEALRSMPAPAAALVVAPIPELAAVSAPVPTPRRVRRPLPVAAIAAALLLALITGGPVLLDALRGAPGTVAGVVTAAPFFFRVGSAFVKGPWVDGAAALFVRCASAVLLAAVGLQVARVKSRSGSWQEGGV